MKHEVNIFSCRSQWMFALNGLIFFKYDKLKWLKLFLMILIHGFYFWCLSNIGIHLKEFYSVRRYPGIALLTTIFCRSFEVFSIISKMLWFHYISSDMTEFLLHLQKEDEHSKININNPTRLRRYWIPTSLFICSLLYFSKLLIECEYSEANYIFCLLFPCIKDTLEFCFWDDILHVLQEKFRRINNKLSFYEKSVITKKQSLWRGGTKRHPFAEKEIRLLIPQIRNISRRHNIFVNLTHKFSFFAIPIVAVTLIVKLVEMINGVHFIITYILHPGPSFLEAIRRLVWCLGLFQFCIVILKSWNDISSEANKTVEILHDIWNKYAEMKIFRELLYMQFISMKFLSTKLKFTGSGFYPLNWTFIHTIVASATTYIIILIQLKK